MATETLENTCVYMIGGEVRCEEKHIKGHVYCPIHTRKHSMESILRYLKAGDRIYVKLESVSASGMSRRVRVYVPQRISMPVGTPDALAIVELTGHAGNLMGQLGCIDRGILVKGCGFDAAQYVAEGLSIALFEKSGALKHQWL